MDVARLNLSHGSYDDHEKVYAEVRAASDERARRRRLVDLQGPKIRTGRFPAVRGARGRRAVHRDHPRGRGRRDQVATTYKGLPGDVAPGDRLLIDDGKVVSR